MTTHLIPTEHNGRRPTGKVVWFLTHGILWGVDATGQTFNLAPSAPKGRDRGWFSLIKKTSQSKIVRETMSLVNVAELLLSTGVAIVSCSWCVALILAIGHTIRNKVH